MLPYLVLLRMGFSVPSNVAADAVSSYLAVSPLPTPSGSSATPCGEASSPLLGFAAASGVKARAGGLLEVHAAAGGWRWSAVVGQKRGARSCIAVQRGPTELCSRPRFAARQTSALAKGALGRCVVSTRRSGLASESSWAPPLRPRPGRRPCVSWWHTCRRCGGPLAACRQLTMACS